MIFTAKLILHARASLVTRRGEKAVSLPSLYQFLLLELPGSVLISRACSILRSVCLTYDSSRGLFWQQGGSGIPWPDLLCRHPALAGNALLVCFGAAIFRLPLAIRFIQQDKERVDSAVACVSGLGMVLMQTKAGLRSH